MAALALLPALCLPLASSLKVMNLYFTPAISNRMNLRPEFVPKSTTSETMCLLLCKSENTLCQTSHFNVETSMCSRWGGYLDVNAVPNPNLFKKADIPLVCKYE